MDVLGSRSKSRAYVIKAKCPVAKFRNPKLPNLTVPIIDPTLEVIQHGIGTRKFDCSKFGWKANFVTSELQCRTGTFKARPATIFYLICA